MPIILDKGKSIFLRVSICLKFLESPIYFKEFKKMFKILKFSLFDLWISNFDFFTVESLLAVSDDVHI